MTSAGDRIELVSTSDEYTNLQPGDRGTVTGIKTLEPPISTRPRMQVWVDWDTGSKLALLSGEDQWTVVSDEDRD